MLTCIPLWLLVKGVMHKFTTEDNLKHVRYRHHNTTQVDKTFRQAHLSFFSYFCPLGSKTLYWEKKERKKALTTPITEGSQPLYKALGPSSLKTVDRAWNIPLYWYGDFSVCKHTQKKWNNQGTIGENKFEFLSYKNLTENTSYEKIV